MFNTILNMVLKIRVLQLSCLTLVNDILFMLIQMQYFNCRYLLKIFSGLVKIQESIIVGVLGALVMG